MSTFRAFIATDKGLEGFVGVWVLRVSLHLECRASCCIATVVSTGEGVFGAASGDWNLYGFVEASRA